MLAITNDDIPGGVKSNQIYVTSLGLEKIQNLFETKLLESICF